MQHLFRLLKEKGFDVVQGSIHAFEYVKRFGQDSDGLPFLSRVTPGLQPATVLYTCFGREPYGVVLEGRFDAATGRPLDDQSCKIVDEIENHEIYRASQS